MEIAGPLNAPYSMGNGSDRIFLKVCLLALSMVTCFALLKLLLLGTVITLLFGIPVGFSPLM